MRCSFLLAVAIWVCIPAPPTPASAEADSAAAHNAAGHRFVTVGRWEKAAAEFERTLALEPRNVEALTYLCRSYLGLGRAADAVAQGLRALAAGYTPRGRAYLAMAYVETGDLALARKYAGAALRLSPDLGIGYGAQALVHLAEKDWDQAITTAKRGIATNDRDPDTARVLARIYEAKGDIDQALYWLREATRYQPAWAPAYGEMGRLLAGRGEHEEAADAFTHALRLAPDDVAARCAYAEALAAAGNGEGALEQAQRALGLAPDSPEAQRALAAALAAKGDYDAAVGHMETSLATGPARADSYVRLAELYRRLGRQFDALHAEGEARTAEGKAAEAIESFATALAMRPDSAPARLRLAKAYLDGGRLDEAERTYRALLDAREGTSEPRADEQEALVGLGHVARARGDIRQAVEQYKKALALDPGDLAAWEGLGRAYDLQWRALSRSVVRVGVRLTSPKEPFVEDVDMPGGPVRVEGEIAWVQRGVGSGFVVNGRGDVVTNAHVVEILRPRDWDWELTMGIRRRAGEDVCDFQPAEVVAYDVDLDLAVVRVKGSGPKPKPLPIGSETRLSTGDWVFELGHPLGGGYGTNGGSMLRLTESGVEYNAEFKVAMSGGPLVDERGIVVGVVCMGSPTKKNGIERQLAVSAKALKAFLDAHEIPYVAAP
jgi:tetratricopeptide (TPR) repeat protein